MYENQGQKFIIYLKDNRNIVISDNIKNFNKVKDNLIDKLSNSITSNKIVRLETDSDIILIKPSDISAIQISLLGKLNNQKNKKEEVYNVLDLNEDVEENTEKYSDDDTIIDDYDDDTNNDDTDSMDLDEYEEYLKVTKKEIMEGADDGIIDFGENNDDDDEINFDEIDFDEKEQKSENKLNKNFKKTNIKASDLIKLNKINYESEEDKPAYNTVIDQYTDYIKDINPKLINSPDDVKIEDEYEKINSQFKTEDDILNYDG